MIEIHWGEMKREKLHSLDWSLAEKCVQRIILWLKEKHVPTQWDIFQDNII